MSAIALLAASLALAGDTVHEVELLGGAAYLERDDRQLSAVPHHGTSPGFDLGWSPRAPRGAHVVRLAFSPAHLTDGTEWSFTWDGDRVHTSPDALTVVDLQYAYGRRIDAGALTVHLGGTLANHFEDVATSFAFSGMKTYLGVFGLGPFADLRLRLGERHGLEAQAWTPLVAWIGRNPYSVHNAEYIWNTRDNNTVNTIFRFIGDGALRTLNTYQGLHLRLGYAFDLSDRFAVVARAGADGIHLSVPAPLVEWHTGLGLGMRGRF